MIIIRVTNYHISKIIITFFRKDLAPRQGLPASTYTQWGAVKDGSESLAVTASTLFAFLAAGHEPPNARVLVFDRQHAYERFTKALDAQSLAFYPLAFWAGNLERVELARE